ncbi:hypothetical protein QWY86_05310 [Pedobacter aquatilis]|uniref:hypothetical protein n=1 Tax=Pedobacter aquatilis TaxID=351343 RepID=UPI0025B4EC09|nr:hypothetical protein [Pedobacter aquatilis]MDN3586074.1 hypothetical protein [Pedobacter aquatilis]
MTPIEYLKLQAKNLHKDFKTQTSSFDHKLRRNVYQYDPKFFKIDLLIDDLNINEEKFKLGNAQHVIAKLCGLEKWTDLLKASPAKVELSVLLYTNMDKCEVRDWDQYLTNIETENNAKLDDDFKVQIFNEGFLKWQEDVYYEDYRLTRDDEDEIEWENDEPVSSESNESTEQITSLPISEDYREEFIKEAEWSFERIFKRIEPEHPEQTRKLWDAEKYIDEQLLRPDMLPISKDYALSLIDAFLVGYVIQLAAQADNEAENID